MNAAFFFIMQKMISINISIITCFNGDYVNDLTWDYLRAILMMGSSSSTLSPLFTSTAVRMPSKSARMAL